ncbi:MAG: 50S ribosomal protein L13 [Polyangia bacterium]|jgi:large subunit ribosomal protein L13|nr:50S ribosomal protein L13 [Polyangia bacterium]
MQKTYSAKPGEVDRRWILVDMDGQVLGRAATEIAMILRGKHRPTYTPHVDAGDFVVVVNAEKVRLTGNKLTDKKYYSHSGYIGSLKVKSAGELLVEHPDRVVRAAVRGMLPKNTLGRSLLKKLKIYAGPEHPHAAQQPTPHKLSTKE